MERKNLSSIKNQWNQKRYAAGMLLAFVLLWTAFPALKASDVRKQLFDYDWKFALGESVSASAADFDDSAWRKLDLPHDWSIEGNISADAPTGNDGGYFPSGVAWYRKRLMCLPTTATGKWASISKACI